MKSISRCVVLLAAGLLVSLRSLGVAWAEPSAKVVLVATSQESTTARRLEAELRNLDVEVVRVTVPVGSASIRKELQRIAQEQGAFAAVRIVPTDNEAEVWVADRITGKTLVREVLSGKSGVDLDDAISLGAVELLRASLLEMEHTAELKGDIAPPAAIRKLLPPPPPVAAPTAAPKPVKLPAATAEPLGAALWLTIAPSADVGIGKLATGSSIELALKVVSPQGFGIEWLGRLPFYGQAVREKSATAVISSKHLAVLGVLAPVFTNVTPTLSLGILATSVTSNGEAPPPFITREEHRMRYAPLLRAGIGYRVLPYLGLRLDANCAYAFSPLTIRMSDKQVADYGRPSLSLAAGVELRLPLQRAN